MGQVFKRGHNRNVRFRTAVSKQNHAARNFCSFQKSSRRAHILFLAPLNLLQPEIKNNLQAKLTRLLDNTPNPKEATESNRLELELSLARADILHLRWPLGLAEKETKTRRQRAKNGANGYKRTKTQIFVDCFCKKFTFWDPVMPTVRITGSHLKDVLSCVVSIWMYENY